MKIGTKVRFNENVAWAFVGKTGKVIGDKPDCFGDKDRLYVVELDTPTRPADGWSEVETLACGAKCLETL